MTIFKVIRLITVIPFAFLIMLFFYDTALAREPILTINLNTDTYTSFNTPRSISPDAPRPFIDESGNVLIPVRFLEEMKVSRPIDYKESDDWVYINNYNYFIMIQIGSPMYKINSRDNRNGLYTFTDASGNAVSPRIINNRLYLPLRALLEQAFGFSVEYSGGVVNAYIAPAASSVDALADGNNASVNEEIPAPVIELPERIQELRKRIYNLHDRNTVYDAVYEQFGIYDMDAGSGFFIPAWYLDSGILLFHPWNGVSFINSDGIELQLIKTENRLLETIMGSRDGTHDINTLPDDKNYGNMLGLGVINLSGDGKFSFEYNSSLDSILQINGDPYLQPFQRDAFFLKQREGQWKINYEEGFNADTILESIGYGIKVATITLSSNGTTVTADITRVPMGLSCDKAAIKCTWDFRYVNGPYTS